MPELPEVEVLRLSLLHRLPGAVVRSVTVHRGDLREPVDTEALRRVVGARIERLRRRAKYLLVDLDQGATLVVHLGMTGKLTLVSMEEPWAVHEHVAFEMDGGRRLRFEDSRRFGLLAAVRTEEIEGHRYFAQLGIEPLDGEMTGTVLRQMARGRRAPMKSFLMNSRVVVGVGNIYASEALYRAGIHPRRSVARLAARRWDRVAESVQSVLRGAIAAGGTSIADYVDGLGDTGAFQRELLVYGRAGEPCRRCGATVRRIVQTGRSTYYCPRCQR